jgi:hypothetical protein
MADNLPSKTLDSIVRRGLGLFRSAFPDLPMGIKRFLGRTSRGVSRQIWGLHKSVEDIDADIVPSAKTSDDILSEWAVLLGLPDGEGGYGRLKPTAASGGEAALTGVLGTAYADGLVATAEDGTTEIALSGAVTIAGTPPGFGSIPARFVAVTKGAVGNLQKGTVCTWQVPPSGADAKFTLTADMSGGLDTEDNPAVFGRIVSRLQTPPRGGVAEDYREWSEDVSGIVSVYVYPHRSGTGSVDVVIVGGGSGVDRVPSEDTRTATEAAIESQRPRGAASVDVVLPSTAVTGLLVRVRVTPSADKYDFDWNDTAASYTVDTGGYTAGPPATLRLNTLAPQSLKDAINAYKNAVGDKPRLQVLSTGAVVNAPIGCVDYADGGGRTTLTLETVTSAWTPPSNGNTVYAYGPVVATIAAGIKALADSLGPSRASGFADDQTPWQDKLTVSGLIGVAETAIDTDGTKLIEEVPVGGATINGAAVDVQGADNTTDGPELLYLRAAAVTQ